MIDYSSLVVASGFVIGYLAGIYLYERRPRFLRELVPLTCLIGMFALGVVSGIGMAKGWFE